MLIHKIVLCVMAFTCLVNPDHVGVLWRCSGVVLEVCVSHGDDQLWFLFLCSAEIRLLSISAQSKYLQDMLPETVING